MFTKMKPVTLLSLGYLVSIFIGTLLLLLPFSSKTGSASFINALFTATSATCVTGLIPYDTFTNWTMFGQIIILLLIQVGGIGFMTIITLVFMMVGKNIGLYNRTVLMQSAGSYNISGVNVLIRRIVIGTLAFEFIGALILFFDFRTTMPVGRAIYAGIFHSISAFCNAGFDVMGASGGSLTDFYSDPVALITIMCLIVIGGSGFIVWSDLVESKFNVTKIKTHSKIVLLFNGILILVGAILFYFFEFSKIGINGSFTNLSFSEKVLNAFFLSISPRTAGFNAIDTMSLSASGKLLTIIFMFIGGNSGSTAGGLKVTTFIIVLASLLSSARGNDKVVLFKRRVPDGIVKQSGALFTAYVTIIIFASLLISMAESFTFEQILFEVVSAIGTVGLTLGVSASCGVFTKIILTLLMFTGRLGALALFSLFMKKHNENILDEPQGRVIVG